MDPFAPLGRFIDDHQQACNYSPGDTPSADCGADGTWHVMWNIAAEVSFACDPHMDLARSRFVFVDSHRIGPACGMPGALWDLGNKQCVHPDAPDLEAAALVTSTADQGRS